MLVENKVKQVQRQEAAHVACPHIQSYPPPYLTLPVRLAPERLLREAKVGEKFLKGYHPKVVAKLEQCLEAAYRVAAKEVPPLDAEQV